MILKQSGADFPLDTKRCVEILAEYQCVQWAADAAQFLARTLLRERWSDGAIYSGARIGDLPVRASHLAVPQGPAGGNS